MAVLITGNGPVPKIGTPASDLEIGSSVFLNVNGSPKEFLVVHQGNPDSAIYDASCDGVWLLMKYIYEKRVWGDSNFNNSYEDSSIHAYLNGNFLGLFDAAIQAAIKTVKIPYRPGSGYSSTISNGVNGLSAKVFLLSATETGFVTGVTPANEGVELDYFTNCAEGGSATERVGYLDGTATQWWLRTPYLENDNGPIYPTYCTATGSLGYGYGTYIYGIRPAIILPGNTKLEVAA